MSIFSNPAGRAADAARAYVDAIVSLVGDRDPLTLLASFPDILASVIRAFDPVLVYIAEADGKWSIAQVVRHLADTELVISVRYRMVIAHDKPEITGFDQDLFADRLHYKNADIEESLALHRTVRLATVGVLRGLAPADFQRVGLHNERGPESLELMTKLSAGHDLVHLRQIERIGRAVAGRR